MSLGPLHSRGFRAEDAVRVCIYFVAYGTTKYALALLVGMIVLALRWICLYRRGWICHWMAYECSDGTLGWFGSGWVGEILDIM